MKDMDSKRLVYLPLIAAAFALNATIAGAAGPTPEAPVGPTLQPEGLIAPPEIVPGIVPNATPPTAPALPALNSDFNSDGTPDIVWRLRGNSASKGANVLWLMNGTSYASAVTLPAVTDLNWFIAGTGDFNGDGNTDILWRNNKPGPTNTQQGRISVWLMSGSTYLSTVDLLSVVDGDWHIRGAGDFDGNGSPDIIWRNYVTGANTLWLMDGTNLLQSSALPSVGDRGWNIYGSGDGDFDGNGTPDIVWRNEVTGANTLWLMNGTTFSAAVSLPAVTPDVGWQICAFGDYSGDGKPDLVWRNYTTGANTLWLMNGTALSSTAALPAVASPDWKLESPR
ncbi:VCBS repeat-containing protein [Gloeobacter morelensis MG652769]|uniref:VCBS repeat-containing protein n=2 Tax=Gloeobacter TaxID=33071 RepID=A0ABY3PNL4_9CYAN|nr:VCBS repeat-containing protein [Gloeobacter morelensis MG652769]